MKGEVMEVCDASAGNLPRVELPGVPEGYKQTEVGVIPEDWEAVRIGDLFEFKNGLNKEKRFFGEGTPIVNYMDVFRRSGIKRQDIKGRVTLSKEEISRFDVKKRDVFFTRTSETVDEIGTASVMLENAIDTVFSGFVLRARPVTSRALDAFNQYCFQHQPVRRQIVASATYTTRALTNGRALSQVLIPLPSEKEQRAIATALSDVDALLEALDRLIAKKRDIKQTTMQQLLTGQTRLPGFEGGWETQSLAELASRGLVKLSRGEVISKKDIRSMPGDFPIYSSSVHNDGLFGKYGKFMFDEDLITWSVDGGGNFFYRPRHKFSVTNVCGFMRVDATRINYRFLAAQLQFLHGRKSFDYQTKAHPSVIRQDYEVRLPTLPEQVAVANILADMDADLKAQQQRRTKTAALKQAMMQELLTGRTRLVEAASKERAYD